MPWVIILHFALYQLLYRLNWLYPVMYCDQLPLCTYHNVANLQPKKKKRKPKLEVHLYKERRKKRGTS